jgi:hypothetical protein
MQDLFAGEAEAEASFGVAMNMVQSRRSMQWSAFWTPLRERRCGLGLKMTLINGVPKGHCVIRPLGA